MNRLIKFRNFTFPLQNYRLFSLKSFGEAKEALNKLKNEPENDVKLKIYGLYKQATEGDCTAPEPGMFEIVKKAKWEAWNSLKSTPQDNAKQEYITLINGLVDMEKPAEGATGEKAEEAKKSPSDDFILIKKADGVLKITLNRPDKYNALTMEMYEKWTDALVKANADEEIKMVTVSATGKYFSSGNDLQNFAKGASDMEATLKKAKKVLQHFVAAFIDLDKPIVALVQGPAIGITVTTMALYDYIIASDEATFATPFTSIAHTPEGCSSYTFPLIMGRAKANGMLMFNETITAAEAFDCGFVGKVVPKDKFDSFCTEFVNTNSKLPPMAMFFSKELIFERLRDTLHQINNKECSELADRWASDEFKKVIIKKLAQMSKK